MRKIYLILAFCLIIFSLKFSYAHEHSLADQYEATIIERLIVDSTKKENPYIYIYSEDREKKELFKEKIKKFAKHLKITSKLYKADFVIVLNLNRKKDFKKPSLALDFSALENCPSCIGVFSWKNGRPNLVLFKEKLIQMTIRLPKEYSYFIE